jgi:hypothetical protein
MKKYPPTEFSHGFQTAFSKYRQCFWQRKTHRINPHISFRRSYREDYSRPLPIPGLASHAGFVFKTIFKNWRLFLPLIILAVTANILLVGLMNESTYQSMQQTIDDTNQKLTHGQLGKLGKASLLLIGTITSGGLSNDISEVQRVFAIILFLIIWLVTIYILRHRLAGHRLNLRDSLYNALTPLISTFCVLIMVVIQCIPIMLVLITYSAAVATEFLDTPFYALVYFIFAAVMSTLSIYWLSGSLLALVAVTAPGLYPMTAIYIANDLIIGHRIKFIIRVFYLLFVTALLFIVVMLPIILIDLWASHLNDWFANLPVVPFFILCLTAFSFVYISAYLYLLYRQILSSTNSVSEQEIK